MTHTLTDEDGRKAQYALTPNHAGMTMTVNTEEAKAFDAEAFIGPATLEDHHPLGPSYAARYERHEVLRLVKAAYEAGKREAVPDGVLPIESAPVGEKIIAWNVQLGAHETVVNTHEYGSRCCKFVDLYTYRQAAWFPTHWIPSPFNEAELAPSHTDLMIAPEDIDAAMLSASPKAGE